MAKSKKAAPAAVRAKQGSELIVVMQSDASLRSAGATVASASGKKVSGINNVLKNFKATLTPVFGAENRLVNIPKSTAAAFENASIDAASFYVVHSDGDLNAIAKAMLSDGLVEAAYVKPPAEAPVMHDGELNSALPSPDDAPPVTPNFTARQLYLDAAPGGIDARYAWTLNGGKGNGTRIIDIEGAWRFTHEDLVANQGGVIAGTPSADIGWRNHGTAVAGEFGGDENNFGITGICPAANTRAISIFGGGMGSAIAIRKAADALSAGDIILIELHRPGPRFNYQGRNDQRGYIAIEWWPDDYAAILYATGKGVIVVEAGGNGAENLSDALYNTRPAGFPASWRNPFNTANPTSNAVLVGAGAPPPGTHGRNHGPDRSRLDFSNYGARLDVQGWGREVTTTGYGDLQGGANEDFWYTDTFSGTSSASPIIVGALGSIQGRLRNRSKPLLTPATARNLLRTTGSPQQDAPGRPATQRIGNRPNLRQAFSTLGIGGVVKVIKEKDFKDVVKDVKEKERKELIKEGKELVKEHIKEFKEGKEIIKEKDLKEFKEGKEFEKLADTIGGNPDAGQPSLEQRLQGLEASLQQLTHFISAGNRPDLQASLFAEGGAGEEDLQKNSADAKGVKDDKDMDTM